MKFIKKLNSSNQDHAVKVMATLPEGCQVREEVPHSMGCDAKRSEKALRQLISSATSTPMANIADGIMMARQ